MISEPTTIDPMSVMITMIQNNGGFFLAVLSDDRLIHVDKWHDVIGAVRHQIAVVDRIALRTTLPFSSSVGDDWRWRQNS